MGDINFEKYAADNSDKKVPLKERDPLLHSALTSGLFGGATALWKSRNFDKEVLETATNAGVESSKVLFPTLAGESELKRVLGENLDMFSASIVNAFDHIDPATGANLLPSLSGIQAEMGALVKERPIMRVLEFKYKPEVVRKVIEETRAAEPFMTKLKDKLKYVGKPAAIAAAVGFLGPLLNHVIMNNIVDKTPAEKDNSSWALAKGAAESLVNGLEEQLEKEAAAQHVDKIATDVDLHDIIDKYGSR